MVDFLIYGKIIIDDIRLANGQVVSGVLGGGGPQAAFGARLWQDSVGFLSRSGSDIEAEHGQTLQALAIDLQGWQQYPDIPTPRTRMLYDENEYMVSGGVLGMVISREDWYRLLGQVLPLPADYSRPRLIHLVTEFFTEPMVETARQLAQHGAIFSLEPIIDSRAWSNRAELLALLPQVDLVTPDWPAASGLAGSDEPRQVMAYWAKLGSALVAVRHGQHGSYVWDRQHDQIWHIPAVPVKVVDPTGAGNSYGGGLAAGWAASGEARTAGCYGAVSAKFLVERAGLPALTASIQQEARRLLPEALASARRL
jgi:sugar/nucleoside kinase (ribokinase family)